MQKHLSDYQKAALQVMGIPVWTLNKDDDDAQDLHSKAWLDEHQDFIHDLEYAIGLVTGNDAEAQPFKWYEGEKLEVVIADNAIYAPKSMSSASGAQKKRLWQSLSI